MRQFNRVVRGLARAMAAVLVLASLPLGTAQAGMVTTDRVIGHEAARQHREAVLEFFGREDVRQQFEELGVDPGEAAARADSLSDSEIARIAGQIEQLPAGQDAASAIIGAAVAIFVILIIPDILGFTNVFPFVSSIQ